MNLSDLMLRSTPLLTFMGLFTLRVMWGANLNTVRDDPYAVPLPNLQIEVDLEPTDCFSQSSSPVADCAIAFSFLRAEELRTAIDTSVPVRRKKVLDPEDLAILCLPSLSPYNLETDLNLSANLLERGVFMVSILPGDTRSDQSTSCLVKHEGDGEFVRLGSGQNVFS